MISDKIILVVAIIIGIAVGFGVGFLSKALVDKVKIVTLEKERDQALLAKMTMQKQWEIAKNELEQTKVLLRDTLSAIEILKKYQAVDEETKKRMKELKDTYDAAGKPTDVTYDKFRKMLEEMNKKNQAYNNATPTTPSTGAVTDAATEATLLVIESAKLSVEVQNLFEDVIDLLLKEVK